MVSSKTDPDLAAAIIEYLDSWRNDTAPTNNYPPYILEILQLQSEIGWQQMFEGFTHLQWEETQATYYKSIKSLRTGRRWITQLIQKFWGIAWDMWDQRNEVLHEQQGSTIELQARDNKLSLLYNSLKGTLPHQDSYLFTDPLKALLKRSSRTKQQWIAQAVEAKKRQRRRILLAHQPSNEHRQMLAGMQHTMQNWLQRSR